MYKEIEIWTAVCDGCGKDINEGSEFSGWNEKKYNDAICEEAGWLVERDEHFCPDCYYYDIDDNIVFKRNLKLNEMKKLDFDFSCLPAWAKWIAMDGNGNWYWYDQRPDIMLQMAWEYSYGIAGLIPKEYKPIFNGNWKDSLFEVSLRQ